MLANSPVGPKSAALHDAFRTGACSQISRLGQHLRLSMMRFALEARSQISRLGQHLRLSMMRFASEACSQIRQLGQNLRLSMMRFAPEHARKLAGWANICGSP